MMQHMTAKHNSLALWREPYAQEGAEGSSEPCRIGGPPRIRLIVREIGELFDKVGYLFEKLSSGCSGVI